jgi:hypothetical protein
MAVVYRHIRKDTNMPFYVGIGKDIKRAYSKFHRNVWWNRIVSKTEYDVHILFEDIDYELAKEKEKEFISIYKRVIDGGTLCNITLGGDGCLGGSMSQEGRRAISYSNRTRKESEETKAKKSKARIEYCNNNPDKKCSEKQRKTVSDRQRGSNNVFAKLTDDDVLRILMMKDEGKKVSEIKAIFAVSQVTVYEILKGKTWKHIDRTWKKQNH